MPLSRLLRGLIQTICAQERRCHGRQPTTADEPSGRQLIGRRLMLAGRGPTLAGRGLDAGALDAGQTGPTLEPERGTYGLTCLPGKLGETRAANRLPRSP